MDPAQQFEQNQAVSSSILQPLTKNYAVNSDYQSITITLNYKQPEFERGTRCSKF